MANVTYIVRLKERVTRVANRVQKSLSGIQFAAEKAANSIDSIGMVAGTVAVAGLFKMGAELEKTTLFFNVLTGSVEKGTKLFSELTEFANTTPFSNQLINRNAQTLLAFGTKTEKITKILRMLGDVAGGDEERFKNITLAFAQMSAAGRLMGQDLLQMVNAGFNPLQIISEKTGKSMLELKKMMEKGQISTKLVTKAFELATGPGGRFFNLTQKMSTTMAGKWSTAMGKARFLVSQLGLSMKDIFTPVLDGAIKFIDRMSKMKAVLIPVLKSLTVFASIVIGLTFAIKAWIVVQKVINVLLIANPIGVVVVALAALVSMFVVLFKRNEKFRNGALRLFAILKKLASVMMRSLKPALNELRKLFILLWKETKKVISVLVDLFNKFFTTSNNSALLRATMMQVVDIFNIFRTSLEILIPMVADFLELVISLFTFDKEGIGKSLKSFFEKFINAWKRIIKLVHKGFKDLAVGASDFFKNLFRGKSTQKDLQRIGKGTRQTILGIFGVDADKSEKQANKLFDRILKIRSNVSKGVKRSITPGVAEGAGIGSIGLSDEVKKLQAEGVVSGGIKTFNININEITGINTLSVENVESGADQAGKAVIDALLKGLADIKNIG